MDGVRDIGWADLPCNFVQIMENAVDPHHVEFLHGRYFQFVGQQQGFDAPASFAKKHVKVGFDAFEWGIIKRRVVEGATEEDDDWAVGHPLVFPYNMRVGGANIEQMQIRVPIDRTTTRFMLYSVHAPEGIEFPEQPVVPDYQIPVFTEDGRHRTDYVEGQDIMAWVTQGADHGPHGRAPGPFRRRRHDAAPDVQGGDVQGRERRGPARHDPRGARPDRSAVREEQVRRRAAVRSRLHRHGLEPVQPPGGRSQEAAHHRLGEPAEGMTLVNREIDSAFGLDIGRGWFPADAESHRRDAPKFCPSCAAPLGLTEGGRGLATEYWLGGDRVFVCYCAACEWSGDIVLTERVVGHEAAE